MRDPNLLSYSYATFGACLIPWCEAERLPFGQSSDNVARYDTGGRLIMADPPQLSTLDELEAELMADDRVRARIGKIPFWLRLAKWRIKVKRLIRR